MLYRDFSPIKKFTVGTIVQLYFFGLFRGVLYAKPHEVACEHIIGTLDWFKVLMITIQFGTSKCWRQLIAEHGSDSQMRQGDAIYAVSNSVLLRPNDTRILHECIGIRGI